MEKTKRSVKETIKYYWHKFGAWVFWPKFEYHSDYRDNNGKWHLMLYDFMLKKANDHIPNRRDVTQTSNKHLHYNCKEHDLQMGWKFDDVKLNSDAEVTVYILGKDTPIKELKERKRNELMKTAQEHKINLSKMIDVDVGVFFPKVLSTKDKIEITHFIANKFATIYQDLLVKAQREAEQEETSEKTD